jgi:hypothetical protein
MVPEFDVHPLFFSASRSLEPVSIDTRRGRLSGMDTRPDGVKSSAARQSHGQKIHREPSRFRQPVSESVLAEAIGCGRALIAMTLMAMAILLSALEF